MGALAAIGAGLKFAGSWLWGFLRSIPWQGWACVALIVLVAAYGHWRYNAGQADVQARFDAHLASDKAQLDRAKADAKNKELAQAASFAATAAKLAAEYADAKALLATTLDDLRAARLRVRVGAVHCPRLPAAASGAGRSDETATGELSDQTARSLLGIATEADQTAQRLTACQAILKAERE
jgi:hypothetical protein